MASMFDDGIVDLNFEWKSRLDYWTADELNMMQGWIDSKRRPEDLIMDTCPVVLPEQLNQLQRVAFEIIKSHNSENKQLLMILLGAAGCGKTFTIHAIATYLNDPVESLKLAAPTAKAAFLINGDTIHQLFAIRSNDSTQYDPLEGESLRKLQQTFANIKFVIIDEYSMLSQSMLARIDQRMRQITQLFDADFGGMSVLLTGDPGQLLPVAATCLYETRSSASMNISGFVAYSKFETVITLSQQMRQELDGDDDQKKFIELLPRFRNGDCTLEDYEHLKKRFLRPDNIAQFADAISIFAYNQTCDEHNINRIKFVNQPITILQAVNQPDYCKKYDADQFKGLRNEIYLCIGAKVVITTNIWKKYGIVNGATGTVKDIIYRFGDSKNLPDIVIIHLDRYSGPQCFEDSSKTNWIPFDTETAYNMRTSSTRRQFPFRLAYAITVHKSQGETLQHGVIDFDKSEKSLGSSYVQLTRFKKFNQFCIKPFSYDRITKQIKESKNLIPRMKEEARLADLTKKTLEKYNSFNF